MVFSTAAWNEIWKGYKDLKEREGKKSRQKNTSEVGALTLNTGCAGIFSKPSLFSHGKEAQTPSPVPAVAAECPEKICGKLFWNECISQRGMLSHSVPEPTQLNGHLRHLLNSGKLNSIDIMFWGSILLSTYYLQGIYSYTGKKWGDLVHQVPKMKAKLMCWLYPNQGCRFQSQWNQGLHAKQ